MTALPGTIPVGAILTRRYYALRTSPYTRGQQFDTWDEAVTAAQAEFDKRITALNATAPWNADVREMTKRNVYLETRVVMVWDRDADDIGGSMDFAAEIHRDVTALRTRASFGA
jgi:hypothetical protein